MKKFLVLYKGPATSPDASQAPTFMCLERYEKL